LRVRIPSEAFYSFNFPIFKNSIKQLLNHDEINIVKDYCFKKIANSLDFGEFRQIILYVGLST